VVVLLKQVDLRPAVDPLTGETTHDPHGGLSAADRSALELALVSAERLGLSVRALSAGGPESDEVLRLALASGAGSATRVHMSRESPSEAVAGALASVLGDAVLVWCGDHSLDRGSGSVPALVAGHLGYAQALGLAAVGWSGDTLAVQRRLDGGRREVLLVRPPAVVSVEAGVAPLRRAPLDSAIAASSAAIEVVTGPPVDDGVRSFGSRPFRPRPRVLEGPASSLPVRDRVRALAGIDTAHEPPRVVRVEADEAAAVLLEFLAERGYGPPVGDRR
jgi:electron transfer flavoprotein beta subunit